MGMGEETGGRVQRLPALALSALPRCAKNKLVNSAGNLLKILVRENSQKSENNLYFKVGR